MNDGLTRHQRYYRKHKEETAAKVRAWFLKHPGANAESCRAYYGKTADRQRERARNYYLAVVKPGKQTDSGRIKARIAKQNQMRRLVGKVTVEDWLEILTKYGWKCAYCGATERLEMDHVIPASKGGKHDKSNIVPACKPCNSSRGNRHVLPPRLGRTK